MAVVLIIVSWHDELVLISYFSGALSKSKLPSKALYLYLQILSQKSKEGIVQVDPMKVFDGGLWKNQNEGQEVPGEAKELMVGEPHLI